MELTHPESPDLATLLGTILTDNSSQDPAIHCLCVYGDHQVHDCAPLMHS